ncbi:MAG TPA: hypothetical protein PLY52_06530 [Methanothrix sp.]|jgi:hypothetical protein|uniref:hypothetical protein n=1 Tax=Methanothrix sp. TaxID=90426 RepID=UPI002C79680A|nr:hypothetical protein [Methanothrix sp.]MDI9417302.1 hypothetical protein [Euryarchaeota archaeon]HON35945.1 hypothetical protein [Methanothrix sp.]
MDDIVRLEDLLTNFEESIKTKDGHDGLMDLIVELVQLVVIEGKYIIAMENDIKELKKQLSKK